MKILGSKPIDSSLRFSFKLAIEVSLERCNNALSAFIRLPSLDVTKYFCCTLIQNGMTIGVNDMVIGKRIHFFRLLRGMTRKYLVIVLDSSGKSADVCFA